MLKPENPHDAYRELFEAVQTSAVLRDSKTFVDAVPKDDPAAILSRYREESGSASFDLLAFVQRHFELPGVATAEVVPDTRRPVREHIDTLWDVLSRDSDTAAPRSSLIPLPHPYIVPGGRFREIYYWDSYYTLLGLAAAGRLQAMRDMVNNFAWLIEQIGFVPNGNRSYYCSRSQPPYFALMVELLATTTGDAGVYRQYLPQLAREHAFWMDGSDESADGPVRRVVSVDGGWLNRYWDDEPAPRPESYAEDVALAAAAAGDSALLYRNLRASCESGWDFSSRWLADANRLASVRTTDMLPVDLNALMCKLEFVLVEACAGDGDVAGAESFRERAETRRDLLQTLFFDKDRGVFTDLLLPGLEPAPVDSIACAYPLYLQLATTEQAGRTAGFLHDSLLSPGGWRTTAITSSQQWDSPNGWAPMQWVCYRGLLDYGFTGHATTGATRWVRNNIEVYRQTGRLMEKYDVVEIGRLASGGEYDVQDGFGWTNGVLLSLMNELGIDDQ